MDDFERRKAEIYAKAIADFPYKHIEVRGEDALSSWEELKAAGGGVPVVIGDDESMVRIMDQFDPSDAFPRKSTAEILDAAARLKIPDDLFARRNSENIEDREATEKLLSGPDANLPSVVETRDDEGHIVHIFEWFAVKGAANGQVPPGISLDKNSRTLSPTL